MRALAPNTADRLEMDFAAHNREVKEVWETFEQRRPVRVPMILGTNSRYFMFCESANPSGVTFEQYLDDPDVMFDTRLAFARWSRFNLLYDTELGLPEKWTIGVDFQNFYEAAWLGCQIIYMDDQVPDTVPVPAFADAPQKLIERGLPDPFGGLMGKARAYYEHFVNRAKNETYLGRPIEINPASPGLGTDGPFTVACNVCSPETVCLLMYEDPKLFDDLLGFIVDANIARVRAWRAYHGLPAKPRGGIADDSVALISTESYRRQVMPHHRRYFDALFNDEPRSIHLCGNATRLFKCIAEELNVDTFDTGFPVDFGGVRAELGPDVRFSGGPHVELLLSATPQQVRDETARILTSGIMEGGRFVLREGNNLAPHTPLENTEAMYHACREFGVYRS